MIHNFFSKLKSDYEMILFKLGDNNGKKGEKLKRKDERKGKKTTSLPYRQNFSPQYLLDVNVDSLTLRDLDVTCFIKAVGVVLKIR